MSVAGGARWRRRVMTNGARRARARSSWSGARVAAVAGERLEHESQIRETDTFSDQATQHVGEVRESVPAPAPPRARAPGGRARAVEEALRLAKPTSSEAAARSARRAGAAISRGAVGMTWPVAATARGDAVPDEAERTGDRIVGRLTVDVRRAGAGATRRGCVRRGCGRRRARCRAGGISYPRSGRRASKVSTGAGTVIRARRRSRACLHRSASGDGASAASERVDSDLDAPAPRRVANGSAAPRWHGAGQATPRRNDGSDESEGHSGSPGTSASRPSTAVVAERARPPELSARSRQRSCRRRRWPARVTTRPAAVAMMSDGIGSRGRHRW